MFLLIGSIHLGFAWMRRVLFGFVLSSSVLEEKSSSLELLLWLVVSVLSCSRLKVAFIGLWQCTMGLKEMCVFRRDSNK